MLLLLPVLLYTAHASQLQFFKNYQATGSISLPYAEIKEPFHAWYSSSLNKSRIDVYGGMVKNVVDVSGGATYKIAPMSNEKQQNVNTCFKTTVEEGEEIAIQGVLPDVSLFTLSGTELVNGFLCNKWVYHDTPNNTHLDMSYTLYVYGDSLPLQFVMKGFNIISGSHADEYVVDYTTFAQADDIPEAVFSAPYQALQCGDYPGPGQAGIDEDVFADLISGTRDHTGNFNTYKTKYGKAYDSKEEHSSRYAVYLSNVRYIASTNRRGLSYRLGENHMLDWYTHEHTRLRGKLYTGVPNGGEAFNPDDMEYKELPSNMDLRIKGAIGEVKDQAICGSCWSFATTGSIEGAFYKQHGYRVSLSEQSLMDCSWGYGNNACDGGEEWRAYEWIKKHGGIAYEEEYGQYLMADGYCHYNKTSKRVVIKSYTNVTSGDAEALKLALFNKGAVAVNIDASHRSLSFYESGVYYEPKCKNGDEDLDHAVLAVGWGTLDQDNYWIVKNSWSTHWGNVGYVLMSAKDNNCGVTTDPTYVEVE